ncbi:MAG: flagellar basal body-associated FliL family protein [Pirellulaceae bacterium]
MAADEKEEGSQKGSTGKLIMWLVVAVVAVGGGFATPLVVAKIGAPAADGHSEDTEHAKASGHGKPSGQSKASGHGKKDSHGGGHGSASTGSHSNEETAYIDFPELVAVLGKSKFSRYLKIDISLQVASKHQAEVEEKMTHRSAVLRNRIISHIAEITEEDLAGQHGYNQLRREIHGFFNELLFEDGIERIQDVLFREFQVQ